ncbi:MAG: hypothetical protein M1327_01350 [Candidatus Thermoplasmatota archaeon]|nr:hypothetical protein [Candidatus Thermoplasmatota archaeon]
MDSSRIIELRELSKSVRKIPKLVEIKRPSMHEIFKSVSEEEMFVGHERIVSCIHILMHISNDRGFKFDFYDPAMLST